MNTSRFDKPRTIDFEIPTEEVALTPLWIADRGYQEVVNSAKRARESVRTINLRNPHLDSLLAPLAFELRDTVVQLATGAKRASCGSK